MKNKSPVLLLVVFLSACIQINMPPVDDYITILLSLVSSKKSNSTQQAASASDSIPPTISYSGSPYVLTLNLPMNTITPAVSGTITSCNSSPDLPTGLVLDNTTCAISGTPTIAFTATGFTITASNAYGSTTATINIAIIMPGVTLSTNSVTAAEGGATGSYTLVLARPPTSNVTVSFNTGTQVNSIANIVFTISDWNIPQTVTVTAIDDNIIEWNHIQAISHSVSSSDTNYNGVAVNNVTVNLTDNDDTTFGQVTHFSFNAGSTTGTNSYTLSIAVGSPTLTTDRYGTVNGAYSFNGSSCFRSNLNVGITGSSVRTLSFWIKYDSNAGVQHSVNWGVVANGAAFGSWAWTNTIWFYRQFSDYDTGSIVPFSWEHWIFVYDGSTIYALKNGVFVGSAARSINTTNSQLYIGCRMDMDPARSHIGSIDEVRVYNRTLSAAEVLALYNIEKP